jgi:hypothetical protein
MNTTSFLSRLGGALLLAVAGSACSGAAPAPAPDLMQQLRAEIGSAACDSTQQCQTVAIGNKACGGPESYLAWSSKASDGAKVLRLAAAHSAKRKSENEASGMLSTCSAVMDPGATCSAGRCVTGGGNAAM